MTRLVIRLSIVLFLGLMIVGCATTVPPTSSPTPIAAVKEAEAKSDLEASDLICGRKRPDDRYRGTYYSAVDLGESEQASAVAGWGTAQVLAGLSATDTVFFVAYCDMREAGLPQVEAHNLAASVAIQNEDWASGRVAVPQGPEGLGLVMPYKPLVAASSQAPIPTPEPPREAAPTVARPPFVWAADRTPTPLPAAPMPATTPQPIDYDGDGDGLIEVRTLAQLNAIRWDYNGDGQSAPDDSVEYRSAFPQARDDMGCPDGGCSGYELVADLDFDTNGNGQADAGDVYWNDGDGWRPMRSKWAIHREGLTNARDVGTFEGNGHTIANLWKRPLFQDNYGSIRNLVLSGVYVFDNCAALVCENYGTITGVTASGEVTSYESGAAIAGGLVAVNNGTVSDSTAHVNITAEAQIAGGLVGSGGTITNSTASGIVYGNTAGGLVGEGGTIMNSTATGAVYGYPIAGGLVGVAYGTITNSTATGDVSVPSECGGFDRYGCGLVGGLVGLNDGYVITNSTANGDVSGHSNAGGLVGRQPLGEIIGCEATGAVTGTAWSIGGLTGDNAGVIRDSTASGVVSGENQIGGLVGISSGKIEGSEARGAVSGVEHVGGLVGRNDSFEGIRRSEASGDVDGHSYVGGLVGATYGTVRDSEARGDVEGVEYVGGLAGGVGGDTESVGFQIGGALLATEARGAVFGVGYVGGLAGIIVGGTIRDSTASGNVSGEHRADALVGANQGGQITNSRGIGTVSTPE